MAVPGGFTGRGRLLAGPKPIGSRERMRDRLQTSCLGSTPTFLFSLGPLSISDVDEARRGQIRKVSSRLISSAPGPASPET